MVSSLVGDSVRLYCCAADKTVALDVAKLSGSVNPELWTRRGGGCNTCSPVLSNGMLLLISDTGITTCMDCASGMVKWRKRLPGEYFASPVTIGDFVYFCNRDGTTTVMRADSGEIVAVNEFREATYASFAPVSFGIVVRTEGHLLRVALGDR